MRDQMASGPQKQKKTAAASAKALDRDDDDFRREIGERLRLTRKALYALGIAPRWQKDFATTICFPGSTYNQVESGKQILTPAQAVRIYQRYGISLNWIYIGSVDELPSKLVDAIEAEKMKRQD